MCTDCLGRRLCSHRPRSSEHACAAGTSAMSLAGARRTEGLLGDPGVAAATVEPRLDQGRRCQRVAPPPARPGGRSALDYRTSWRTPRGGKPAPRGPGNYRRVCDRPVLRSVVLRMSHRGLPSSMTSAATVQPICRWRRFQPLRGRSRVATVVVRDTSARAVWRIAEEVRTSLNLASTPVPHQGEDQEVPPPRRLCGTAGSREACWRRLLVESQRIERARRESAAAAPTGADLLEAITRLAADG